MAVRIELQGRVVGRSDYDYDFADDKTGEKIKGTAHSLWMSQGFDQEPVKVRITSDQSDDMADAGVAFGTEVHIAVELYARGNLVSYKLVGFQVAELV